MQPDVVIESDDENSRKDMVTTMLIFYLTIPFMVLGAAIAIVPLVFAMRHQQAWENSTTPAVVRGSQSDNESLAA